MLCCGDNSNQALDTRFEGQASFLLKTSSTECEWITTRVLISGSSLKLIPEPPHLPIQLAFGPQFQLVHQVCDQEESKLHDGPTRYRVMLCTHGARSHLFCVHSEAEAMRWVVTIHEVLATAKRPLWQPDQEAASCSGCRHGFGVLKRRHHCRSCGLLFCGNCTQRKEPIAPMGYTEKVRVCAMCSEQMREAASQTMAVQQNPYLEWIRSRCLEAKAADVGGSGREASFEFSTINGNWLKESVTSMATSVDSAVAAVCIKAAEQHLSSMTDCRTTFTGSETWSETEDSNIRDVLAAAEDLQRQSKSQCKRAEGKVQDNELHVWHGTSQVH